MKVWITLEVGVHDRPLAEVTQAGADEVDSTTVWLTDEISISGARTDVQRWVRDLCSQVALQEDE